jgi:hypothetical protein
MAQTVFSWASVAKGKPQLSADIKEKEKREKSEREQMAWEAKAPLRARQTVMLRAKLEKEREANAMQDEHDRKFSKENGWLMGQWPNSHEVPYDQRLTVPKNVNERARDWTERALASWWQEWEKCETVEALRGAFINAFVPYALEHGNYRGADDYVYWEKIKGLVKGTNEERYANMLKWLKEMEADKANPPYWNTLWVACKNITFENCLWAMNVEAQTFRAMDKLLYESDHTEVPITGFLKVEGPVVTWLADFTKYIPYLHNPKPKSKQAIEARRRRDEEDLDRMLMSDYY